MKSKISARKTTGLNVAGVRDKPKKYENGKLLLVYSNNPIQEVKVISLAGQCLEMNYYQHTFKCWLTAVCPAFMYLTGTFKTCLCVKMCLCSPLSLFTCVWVCVLTQALCDRSREAQASTIPECSHITLNYFNSCLNRQGWLYVSVSLCVYACARMHMGRGNGLSETCCKCIHRLKDTQVQRHLYGCGDTFNEERKRRKSREGLCSKQPLLSGCTTLPETSQIANCLITWKWQ